MSNYNVVRVSGEQRRDPVIHTHVFIKAFVIFYCNSSVKVCLTKPFLFTYLCVAVPSTIPGTW